MEMSYLAHFGVPGMKWGVRHEKPRSGSERRGSKMSFAKKYAPGIARKELRPAALIKTSLRSGSKGSKKNSVKNQKSKNRVASSSSKSVNTGYQKPKWSNLSGKDKRRAALGAAALAGAAAIYVSSARSASAARAGRIAMEKAVYGRMR